MFDPVDPKQSFPALERGILKYWQEEDTFKRSMHSRGPNDDPLNTPGNPATPSTSSGQAATFSFYDGPPFATGLPHYGHLLAGTIKDVIPRYQTMRGKRVERRFGWDCHGLPIENIIEKEHGLKSKQDIETMGVKKFNELCRAAVQRYTKEWRTVVERMGRWVDMDWDYRTMDPDYMESIWWVFKSLSDKKLIYEGHKPMHVCPRCVTPLSNFEVTQGYKDVTDLAVTAMFKILPSPATEPSEGLRERVARRAPGEGKKEILFQDEQPIHILAWTTTPWTLPGNLFLAVHPKVKYITVRTNNENFIVAEERVEHVFKGKDHEIVGKPFAGKTLIGKTYEPLFPYFAKKYADRAFTIVDGKDFVTTEDGTGVVHIAPGFGEDDYAVGKREGIDPPLQHVTMEGKFTAEVTDFAGQDVKPKDDPSKADRKVAEWLEKNGKLFSKENFKHSYPHCWRCDSPLLNYATSSWFVAVEKIKEKMLEANAKTEWVPGHLRDGRFGKWLEGARDWAISRSRYWGAPLPIWRSTAGELEVVGGRDELMSRVPARFTKVTTLRHAESEGNVTPVYQGKEPGTDLTKRGRSQAAATADALATQNVTCIYCSPLKRTQQTAEEIAKKTGAKIVIDERLREVEFGDYEGKSVDFSDLTFVKARRAHKLEHAKVESIYHFPGMETWSQVFGRIRGFFDETLARHRGEHIVVVTHADPCLTVKHFFTKEDPAKITQQPYPGFASPSSYFWDHATGAELDLHKDTVDDLAWHGTEKKGCVELTLVRHAETDWNAQGKAQGGNVDEPLNANGREQVLQSAKKLKGKKFDVIITSDLLRTVQTAEILSKELNVPIVGKWSELRERHFGDWAGKNFRTLIAAEQKIHEDETPSFGHLTPPGGETLDQLLHRVQKALEKILKEFAGKRVLVVGHKGSFQALMTLVGSLNHKDGIATVMPNAGIMDVTLTPQLRRIPEVLDCWFESGSMPYAQSHYPFSPNPNPGPNPPPPSFPADFIAENLDQTRGWFYTLMVLSTALFDLPAFRHCICGGIILAEDGKKMSKRLKNYPDPSELMEQHGADALRFALMSSPVVRAETLRFSEQVVKEAVQKVLLPLWNTYSFFVTYANAAQWEPVASRRSSNHPLDRWIRAEAQDLVNRMTEELDGYDMSATCAQIHDTIDALTNWYVRLSRRRFAGQAGLHTHEKAMEEMHQQDRLDALTTLYDVLLTFCQVLAPFCPFITENMYLNLVPENHGSVHLTDWPQVRKLTKEEDVLLKKTRLLRTVASLGMQIRAEKKIKVRQPLAKATIAAPKELLKNVDISDAEVQLLEQELNVHAIEFVQDPGTIAHAIAMVDARKVGPRLGGRVQEVIQAGKRGEFTLQKDGSIMIGDEVLGPDEAAIVYRGRENEDVAAGQGIVMSLDTRVTPDLELQGVAREIIRTVQKLRKDRGFTVNDRITLQIEGADDVLEKHRETIMTATKATVGNAEGETFALELDDRKIGIRFKK